MGGGVAGRGEAQAVGPLLGLEAQGCQAQPLVGTAADAKNQLAFIPVEKGRRSQVEHHASAAAQLPGAHGQQGGRGHLNPQEASLGRQPGTGGLEQPSHRQGDLIFEAALATGGQFQAGAEPFQLHAAIRPRLAGDAQLPLEHLQGQPKLALGLARAGGTPQPAGRLALVVDLDQPPLEAGAQPGGPAPLLAWAGLRCVEGGRRQGRRWAGQGGEQGCHGQEPQQGKQGCQGHSRERPAR